MPSKKKGGPESQSKFQMHLLCGPLDPFCCVLSDHCFCPLIPSPLAKWNLPNPSSGADEKKQDDKVDQDC